jgi:hypothetical protein
MIEELIDMDPSNSTFEGMVGNVAYELQMNVDDFMMLM